MSTIDAEEPAAPKEKSVLGKAWEAARNGAIGGAVIGALTMRFQNVAVFGLVCGILGGGASLYNSWRARSKSPSPSPE